MRIRSIPFVAVLVALAVLLLAPAAFAGGASLPVLDWTSTQFTAADGAAYDDYGRAVAIDGTTAVVGAPLTTVGANPGQGAVHVYTRVSGQWQLETTLTAADGEAYDTFGLSVAMNDDIIAIGAPSDGAVGAPAGGQASYGGAVYVFTRAGEGWAQVAKLTPPDLVSGRGDVVGTFKGDFGQSVSINGGVLAVGSPGRAQDGAVFVYAWDSAKGEYGLWDTLTAGEVVTTGHRFGEAVCFDDSSADLRLAIGAPGDWETEGAVYVYDTLSDVWRLQQKLVRPAVAGAVGDPVAEDEFGRAVSLRGDVLAVGSPMNLVVSPAPGDDAVGADLAPGAVYVYHYHDKWTNVGTLAEETPELNDGFGRSVAVAGDLSVFVGAPGRDVDDDSRQGTVYAYDWTGQIYDAPYELVESEGGSDDSLGSSLAVSRGRVLAGAPRATVGANIAQGSAWMFALPAPTVRVRGASDEWENTAAHLTFKGYPAAGGAAIDTTQYRIGDGDWKSGAQATIRRQGKTVVQFRAVDVFGTRSATRSVVVRIDTKRPTVVARAASAGAGTIARMTYKVVDPRPSSGLAWVRLVVRNAAGVQVTRAATVPVTTNHRHTVRIKALRLAPGAYTVYLHALDRAGNAQNGWSTATLTVR